MEKILKKFHQRLANISTKNKSLVLLQLTKRLFIDLHSFHFLQKKSSFSILETVLSASKKTVLTTLLDPRDGQANAMSEQLKTILKTHQVILEERGSHDLSIGFPFVTGKFVDGTVVRAPLLFIPVQIWIENNHWYLSRKPDSSIRFNRDFLLAYAFRNQLSVPETLLEATFDDFPSEILPFLTQLYAFFNESVLEINFNRELFEQQLHFFERKTGEELKQNFDVGLLKLFPEAILGFFPLHSSFLAADYSYLLNQTEAFLTIEDHFKSEDNAPEKIREESLFLGFPVDASQEEVIREVKKGKSLVVIGPPGSGKSQLISNLITDFTSRGKKVLVVCQKKAALDTVTSRLTQIGLAPFTAQIHDINTDKTHIFNKLRFQINKINEYEEANKQLDSLALDKQFTWTSRRIQQIETELEVFKKALFDTSYCGKSIKELYLDARNTSISTFESDLFSEFRADDLSIFLEKIHAFVFFRNQIDAADKHALFYRYLYKNQPNEWTSTTDNELIQQVQLYADAFKRFQDFVHEKDIHFDVELPLFLHNWTQDIQKADSRIREAVFHYYKKDKPLITSELKKRIRTFLSVSETVPILEKGQVILSKELLDSLAYACSKAEKRANFSLGKLFFKWVNRSEYAILSEWLPKKWETDNFQKLRERIDLTYSYHSIYQEITGKILLFKPISIADFQCVLDAEKIRNQCKKKVQLADQKSTHTLISSFNTLADLLTWTTKLVDVKEEWERVKVANYLLTAEQRTYIEENNVYDIQKTMSLYLPWVAELHRIANTLKNNELALLERVDDVSEPSRWVENLRQSWSRYWIQRIERQVPILQGVTSKKIDYLENELQTLIATKETISQDKIRLSLREQCCEALEKNRLNHVVSYRELGHQVGKKRQTWPLRKLLDKFSDEIFKLIPCWLATPEVAAGLFPIQSQQSLFDLVIFDEASQCPVEQGLPLILRGKQTVVTGDPKQLPPFDLYQTRIEQDSEDNVLLEVESLLDAATFLFSQLQLNGHYRSQSIELIQFSNQHFYDNKLELIPDYQLFKNKEKTLFYQKVTGVWQNNQNEIEAESVLHLIHEKWTEDSTQSIGVITFNHAQAQLIEKKLEKLALPSHFVRVKNIENVQGDEFDIVIFSVGYAPNTEQKMAYHFGSLSVLGGEKRLNVAITRARKQLHVVSSILPTELHVEQTKNEGPKLLKAFLAYVLEVTSDEYVCISTPAQNTLAHLLVQEETHMSGSPFPFSDLIIREDEGDTSLILTDDHLYYSMKSIKQAHGYFPRLLRQKNWTFTRKWSRNLYKIIH